MLFCEIQVLARRLYESTTHFCGFELTSYALYLAIALVTLVMILLSPVLLNAALINAPLILVLLVAMVCIPYINSSSNDTVTTVQVKL